MPSQANLPIPKLKGLKIPQQLRLSLFTIVSTFLNNYIYIFQDFLVCELTLRIRCVSSNLIHFLKVENTLRGEQAGFTYTIPYANNVLMSIYS